ncbi:MAG: serine aminopeptidase domain-containing protein, partial [Methyloceanibacter sp.]
FMKGVVLPDCPTPYFALGHSMAAAALLRAATKRGGWFNRMVLTAPMIEILNLPFSQKRCAQLTNSLAMCGFGRSAVPVSKKTEYWSIREFEGNPLTSDRERFFRNLSVLDTAPELAVAPPTIGWLNAALAATAQIRSEPFPPQVRIPALMLAAGDDEIVSNKAIEALASRLRAGRQIVLRGSRHEIMQERDGIREQFWAAFDAFIPGAAMSLAS